MFLKNQHAQYSNYPPELKAILNVTSAFESRLLLSHWEKITSNTPLWSLPQLASTSAVKQISVKDESKRSELASFKALGAPNALVKLILRYYPDYLPHLILTGAYAKFLNDFTVISATDGNHGRALAAAAQSIGCPCVIVLHAEVSQERESAIANYGAKIVRVTGNYDQSVDQAKALATNNAWHVVSDTSYQGYETIPADVMQGYGIMAAEIIEQIEQSNLPPITHVFLQAGVGGLPAGVVSYLWQQLQTLRPTFIIVEPEQADCLYQSALKQTASDATGSIDSVMAGLACGKTSPLAWQFLRMTVDFFMLISDSQAVSAMKKLARGCDDDIPIVAGESGAAGMAGFLALDDLQRKAMNINDQSHLMFFNTEGATAPTIYADLVGKKHTEILDFQMTWLQKVTAEK
jgi:diaminopropionate ammonia-lyase